MNKKWFTRFNQPTIDETYYKNMCAATNYFMCWFGRENRASYRDMLLTMHDMVTDGYSGHTNVSNYIVAMSEGFRGDKNSSWHPVLKKEWFTGIVNEAVRRPELKYVPKLYSHELTDTAAGWELHLPRDKYVHIYVDVLGDIMRSLKDERDFSLELLANYIQTFIIGHPFERVNYSVCMSQVNALLYMKGFNPVYHGYFDFECFMYDHDRIEKNFIKMVKGR